MDKDEVVSIYERFTALRQQPLLSICDSDLAGTIRQVCVRPEFAPLLPGIEFTTSSSMGLPFRVADASTLLFTDESQSRSGNSLTPGYDRGCFSVF